jgi:hypothetical protein
MSHLPSKAEWIRKFDVLYKTRPFEQFSLFLCPLPDLDPSDEKNENEEKQKQLLYNLIFESGIIINPNEYSKAEDKLLLENSFNIENFCSTWKRYIEIAFVLHYPDKKLQLQRLVNKSLEVLDRWDTQKVLKTYNDYFFIHLKSATLKA